MASTAGPLATGKVRGRRKVRYRCYDDVITDALRMHGTPHRQLGNWTLAMIVQHLSNAIEASMSGGTFPVRWYLKLLGPYLIKPFLIRGPFPAGFRLPGRAARLLVAAPDANFESALEALRKAIARLATESNRGAHPVAGKLTAAEWDQFHLRHAEMHMSFLVPQPTRSLA